MGKVAAPLLVLVFLTAACLVVARPAFSSATVAEDTWAAKALMHQARAGLGVVAVNGKIYAIGGYNTSLPGSDANEEYNPTTNTWTLKKPMPIIQAYFGTVAYHGKIYVIGAEANEVYDPATDTWETKAQMLTPRGGLSANLVNSKIYLIGGLVKTSSFPPFSNTVSNVTEVYDPAADSWTTKTPIPNAVFAYTSAVVDNRIYIMGGILGGDATNLNQIYDTETDTWSYGTSIPSGVYDAAAAATTGALAPKRIYVIGGSGFTTDGNRTPAMAENKVYDPENDRWTFGAPMPTTRTGLAVAVVNDTLYALGGLTENSGALCAINEQYTPIGYEAPSAPSPSPSQEPLLPAEIAYAIATSIIVIIAVSVAFVLKKRCRQ